MSRSQWITTLHAVLNVAAMRPAIMPRSVLPLASALCPGRWKPATGWEAAGIAGCGGEGMERKLASGEVEAVWVGCEHRFAEFPTELVRNMPWSQS